MWTKITSLKVNFFSPHLKIIVDIFVTLVIFCVCHNYRFISVVRISGGLLCASIFKSILKIAQVKLSVNPFLRIM